MESFGKQEEPKEQPKVFFEDTVVFGNADKELKDLVRKSNGKDENLTKEELERRKDLYQILKPPMSDAN